MQTLLFTVDLTKLLQQKQTLLGLIDGDIQSTCTLDEITDLEGILNLLDAIHDIVEPIEEETT